MGYAFLLVCFILLMVFCICNVIVGIFVQAANRMAKDDLDLASKAKTECSARNVMKLRQLFEELDTDCSGRITMDEFQKVVKKQDVRVAFSTLEISNPEALFRLL